MFKSFRVSICFFSIFISDLSANPLISRIKNHVLWAWFFIWFRLIYYTTRLLKELCIVSMAPHFLRAGISWVSIRNVQRVVCLSFFHSVASSQGNV